MDGFSAWLMAGGCSLYLIGGALFRGVMGHGSPIPRIFGGVAAAFVAPAGARGSTALALASVAIVIAGTLIVEKKEPATFSRNA